MLAITCGRGDAWLVLTCVNKTKNKRQRLLLTNIPAKSNLKRWNDDEDNDDDDADVDDDDNDDDNDNEDDDDNNRNLSYLRRRRVGRRQVKNMLTI